MALAGDALKSAMSSTISNGLKDAFIKSIKKPLGSPEVLVWSEGSGYDRKYNKEGTGSPYFSATSELQKAIFNVIYDKLEKKKADFPADTQDTTIKAANTGIIDNAISVAELTDPLTDAISDIFSDVAENISSTAKDIVDHITKNLSVNFDPIKNAPLNNIMMWASMLYTTLQAWVPIPLDGGSSLKALIVAMSAVVPSIDTKIISSTDNSV